MTEELIKRGKHVYILDKKGTFIRELESEELKNAVFVLGDHEGLPKKELKRFDKKISLGNKTYFASHCVVIVNHEFDVRGLL